MPAISRIMRAAPRKTERHTPLEQEREQLGENENNTLSHELGPRVLLMEHEPDLVEEHEEVDAEGMEAGLVNAEVCFVGEYELSEKTGD